MEISLLDLSQSLRGRSIVVEVWVEDEIEAVE